MGGISGPWFVEDIDVPVEGGEGASGRAKFWTFAQGRSKVLRKTRSREMQAPIR